MPKMIDSEKLLEHLDILIQVHQDNWMLTTLKQKIESGTFSPAPPVQPDIKPGDKVRHKVYKNYGVGICDELSKSKKTMRVHFPALGIWHREFYRLDKLEVIPDDPST